MESSMQGAVEYEFVLPDGSCRYEILDPALPIRQQMFAFKRLHRAVAAWPVSRSAAMLKYRDKLIRRITREKP
jgi:hypothetical protein